MISLKKDHLMSLLLLFPTVMNNVDGPNISPSETVDITPGEVQTPISSLTLNKIRGTPQYFHNTLLDVLDKIRQFRLYTFFLTCTDVKFHWTEIIQVVAHQYGQTLTDE